jgi:hypothetical protein
MTVYHHVLRLTMPHACAEPYRLALRRQAELERANCQTRPAPQASPVERVAPPRTQVTPPRRQDHLLQTAMVDLIVSYASESDDLDLEINALLADLNQCLDIGSGHST